MKQRLMEAERIASRQFAPGDRPAIGGFGFDEFDFNGLLCHESLRYGQRLPLDILPFLQGGEDVKAAQNESSADYANAIRNCRPRASMASAMRGNLDPCPGSSIRRTSFSSTPSRRANSILLTPASRIAT